ncbi:hypothetical protein BLA29_012983, partial [Euroglyphus maynei]
MGRAKTIRLDVKLKLLHDYHHNGDTATILAERYLMHPNTVMRIIRNKSQYESLLMKSSEEQGKNHENNGQIDDNDELQRPKRKRKKLFKPDSNCKESMADNLIEKDQQPPSSLGEQQNHSQSFRTNETRRIMAFKRFFDYIDRIEEIVLTNDYDYNQA